MKEYYLTFRSLTAALSAAKQLSSVGWNFTPKNTPEPLRRKGCGYCIYLREEQYAQVHSMLSRCNYERLYVHAAGIWKELSL